MSGMVTDWTKYNDPSSSVSRPAQIGPIWMEAQHRTGAEINDLIWIENTPASSYPACIPVKTTGLQSFKASELYLTAVWRAVMVDSMVISKKEVWGEWNGIYRDQIRDFWRGCYIERAHLRTGSPETRSLWKLI